MHILVDHGELGKTRLPCYDRRDVVCYANNVYRLIAHFASGHTHTTPATKALYRTRHLRNEDFPICLAKDFQPVLVSRKIIPVQQDKMALTLVVVVPNWTYLRYAVLDRIRSLIDICLTGSK